MGHVLGGYDNESRRSVEKDPTLKWRCLECRANFAFPKKIKEVNCCPICRKSRIKNTEKK